MQWSMESLADDARGFVVKENPISGEIGSETYVTLCGSEAFSEALHETVANIQTYGNYPNT
jgi:hypothetical protein